MNINTENKYNQIDVNKLNQIDMEFSGDPDCDDDFGSVVIDKPNNTIVKNFPLESNKNFDDKVNFNDVDTECSLADDTEDIIVDEDEQTQNNTNNPVTTGIILDFSDDDDCSDQNLVLEDTNKELDYGKVTKDYWKKITKQHSDSNKEGAMGMHFHLVGNQKLEQDMFNRSMGNPIDYSNDSDLTASGLDFISNNSDVGTDASTGIGDSDIGGGEGVSENLSIKYNSPYEEKLNKILELLGFEIYKNSDNTFSLIDLCDNKKENRDIKCNNSNDVLTYLKPYVDDFYIFPLQDITNQNFDNCKDWVNWYTDENKKAYPEQQYDIECCDILANHFDECFK